MNISDEMVNRFLSWKLPDDFAPDAGIVFTPPSHWPTGTNLFTATQARAMLEHALGPLEDERDELREELRLHAFRPSFDDGQDHEDGEPRLTGWECLCCGALEPKLKNFDHLDGCVLFEPTLPF